MIIEGCGRSEQGGRADNQDAFCIRPDLGLYAIADGIGGRPGGGEAAQIAVESFALEFTDRPAPERCTPAVLRAVLSAVIIGADRAHVVHVGDTRVCTFSPETGRLERLSCEHTLAYELKLLNRLNAEQSRDYPYRHHLSRYIGSTQPFEPQALAIDFAAGQWILLFSDGLEKALSADDLQRLLQNNCVDTARELCDKVVDAALERQPPDNLTFLAISCRHAG